MIMAVKITYFVHGTTTDNEQNIAIVAHQAPQLALDVLLREKLGSRQLMKIGGKERPGSQAWNTCWNNSY
ncbi:hypothetical protein D6745_01810 [Candidatus Woesearchaeota archaeon]|nr:MAG: hypothetical protein D6745_01810 [Candidatus Woesearchaeota archaeon]